MRQNIKKERKKSKTYQSIIGNEEKKERMTIEIIAIGSILFVIILILSSIVIVLIIIICRSSLSFHFIGHQKETTCYQHIANNR